MKGMVPSCILTTEENCIEAELDGFLVILAASSGTYFRLNPVARCAWYAIRAGATFGEVCSRVREQFEIDEQTCEGELRQLINELAILGLVISVSDGNAPGENRESPGGIHGV